MPNETYKTIAKNSTGIYKDKGSKFLSFAFPLNNIDSVKDIVSELKKEHHGARHHCWAYKFGVSGEQTRANDDGEPSNTAGKPILGQINSFDITNTLIVVVRYFGGTLLGVGGLIQAYKESTKQALENAKIISKTVEYEVNITCDYEDVDSVLSCIKQQNCTITNQNYNESCEITCLATKEVVGLLQKIEKNKPNVKIQVL